MSFLDSVLSSIGTGSSAASSGSKIVSGEKSDPSIVTSGKRKAEEELDRDVNKPKKAERIDPYGVRDRPSKSPQPVVPNGGPSAKAVPGPAAPAAPSKNPKKGSFAAIMAQAKESRAEPTKVTGTITHKPKEKSRSRKDLIMEREEAKKVAKRGAPLKTSQASKDAANVKKAATEQKAGGAAKLGYQGTMQSAKSGYQGTSKPSTTSSYSGTSRSGYAGTAARVTTSVSAAASRQTPGRRRVEYDESDDYGSEDEDYGGTDLSDMDAGFDDMEEEEEEAERIARKEDAAAQAELERLKRDKDRKRAVYLKGR